MRLLPPRPAGRVTAPALIFIFHLRRCPQGRTPNKNRCLTRILVSFYRDPVKCKLSIPAIIRTSVAMLIIGSFPRRASACRARHLIPCNGTYLQHSQLLWPTQPRNKFRSYADGTMRLVNKEP